MATRCGSGASSAGDAAGAAREACAMAREALGVEPDVVFVFASPAHPLDEVLREARATLGKVDVVGASTAGEITERGPTRGGVAALAIAWDGAMHRVTDLVSIDTDWRALGRRYGVEHFDLAGEARKRAFAQSLTLVLGDGLSTNLEVLVSEIRRATAPHHVVVGGGAADDGRLVESWVGARGRAQRGGVVGVHVASAKPWGVGIGQGVAPRSPRMTVTKAEGNTVLELDGEPTLDVYRRFAAERGIPIAGDALGPFLVSHELGVYFFDEIVRVRAGIAVTEEGGVVFAGEVPESTVVAIVSGTHESYVSAARAASRDAIAGLGGAELAGALVFSCVTRGLVLGDRYRDEVDAVRSELGSGAPIAGFLSYGEIARVRGRLDGYHNNTIVVVAIPR